MEMNQSVFTEGYPGLFNYHKQLGVVLRWKGETHEYQTEYNKLQNYIL